MGNDGLRRGARIVIAGYDMAKLRFRNKQENQTISDEQTSEQAVSPEDLIDVRALTERLVQDHDLSDSDVDEILEATRLRQKQQVLTVAELN